MPNIGPHSIGRYEVVAPLATGGMGELFLARRSGAAGFARLVVLKRLRPELGATATYRDMFFDEARLAARLTHPNVCEVYDLEHHGDDHYLAMPYLEGVAASALLSPPAAPLTLDHVRVVAGILVQVCDGLHHAHELRDDDGAPLGVVHRDVSPGNVFVTTDGTVKLLDFGVAKVRGATAVTDQGVVKGKLAYMAPEQLADGAVDRRADLFCVGILGWEGLAGRPLFGRASASLTAAAVLDEPIARVDAVADGVPAALADVLDRALARDPRRRPATAAALRDALDAAMAAHGGPARPAELARVVEVRCADAIAAQRARVRGLPAADQLATTVWAPARAPRRGRGVWIGAVLAAGVVAAGGAWIAWREPAARAVAAPVAPMVDVGAVVGAVAAAPVDAAVAAPPPTDAAPAAVARPRVRADGWVSIDSTPWATLYIDGKRAGLTPYIHKPLAAGKHGVRAVLEDGRARSFTVVVPEGREAAPVSLQW